MHSIMHFKIIRVLSYRLMSSLASFCHSLPAHSLIVHQARAPCIIVFLMVYILLLHKIYLNRRASRSHSSKDKISPSRTGPLTLRTIDRPVVPPPSASMNSTRTCVTLPVLPVRPRTRLTLASWTGWSCVLVRGGRECE
jgi:hypothetical protein